MEMFMTEPYSGGYRLVDKEAGLFEIVQRLGKLEYENLELKRQLQIKTRIIDGLNNAVRGRKVAKPAERTETANNALQRVDWGLCD